MAFKEKSTGKSNYEELLSMIARTTQWEFPDEITRFCDAMDKASDALGRAGTVLQEDGVFECSARDTALACSDRIVQNISDADFTAMAKRFRQRIETFNDVICEAQNVRLPGDKLSKESEQAIMNATEPMDWIVPGLGTVTGVMGIAGANLISRMLASNREEEAKKEYKRLIEKVRGGAPQVDSFRAVDVNGIWPAPSTDGSKDKAIGDSPPYQWVEQQGIGRWPVHHRCRRCGCRRRYRCRRRGRKGRRFGFRQCLRHGFECRPVRRRYVGWDGPFQCAGIRWSRKRFPLGRAGVRSGDRQVGLPQGPHVGRWRHGRSERCGLAAWWPGAYGDGGQRRRGSRQHLGCGASRGLGFVHGCTQRWCRRRRRCGVGLTERCWHGIVLCERAGAGNRRILIDQGRHRHGSGSAENRVGIFRGGGFHAWHDSGDDGCRAWCLFEQR